MSLMPVRGGGGASLASPPAGVWSDSLPSHGPEALFPIAPGNRPGNGGGGILPPCHGLRMGLFPVPFLPGKGVSPGKSCVIRNESVSVGRKTMACACSPLLEIG